MASSPRQGSSATALAVTSTVAALATAVIVLDGRPTGHLEWIALATVIAVVGESFVPRLMRGVHLSASNGVLLAPIALLDPRSAVAVAVLGVLAQFALERYRWTSLWINLAVTALPVALAGLLHQALGPDSASSWAGVLSFTAACLVFTTTHVLLFAAISCAETRTPIRAQLAEMLSTATVTIAMDVGFAIGLAYLIAQAGWAGGAIAALVAVLQLYSGSLVARANDERLTAQDLARRQTALSWGMVSALLGTLNARNPNLARHSAAVARLSRLVAADLGLSTHDQDVVHTAGLLHDIGQFATADRVVLDGESPSREDWRRIVEHPRVAYELLREMTEFGPVAEIVLHHHERYDGRGYPDRLAGDDIPQASRILFVTEAYDAMTGPGTYRDRRSSLEALAELREHAGRQFDPDVVDALHRVLKGTDHAFRHSDEAHFRDELAVERRIVDERLARAAGQ